MLDGDEKEDGGYSCKKIVLDLSLRKVLSKRGWRTFKAIVERG
jgi:hypothetical protein